MINELTPRPVFALILQQSLHHLLIACQDTDAIRVVLGQRAQHFRHAGGYPPISPAPEKRNVRCVIKESVGLLEFVQIGGHLQCCAVDVFAISGGAICLYLQHREHIHVVDPEAAFRRQSITCRRLPLPVGKDLAEV